ncbi:hypothetical protein ACFSVJ_08230 [Prauserella oleivorans]
MRDDQHRVHRLVQVGGQHPDQPDPADDVLAAAERGQRRTDVR